MSIKLFLVDDHNLFLNGLASILEPEIGIEIIGKAKNGLELLNSINASKLPDVVLTDIRMPIMSGITLTKKLQKKYPKILIVALTMLDNSNDILGMLNAGAKGYVVKNAEKEELLKCIQYVVNGKYFLSADFQDIFVRWKASENIGDAPKLTSREQQILSMLVEGKTSQQMANELNLSRFTIDTHRKNIHKKLGIKSNLKLASVASKYIDIRKTY